jgi:hypothetical protein
LINNALAANAAGKLALTGLLGTFDVYYGPIPTWLCQFVLLFTHDIYTLVTIHATVFYVGTILAIALLVREASLPRSLIGIVALSPAVCLYSRQIWDNSINLPLSMALLAMYASLLRRPATWKLWLLGALCVISMSIYASAITLIAAVVLHGAGLQRRRLGRFVTHIALGATIAVLPLLPYVMSQLPVALGLAPAPDRPVTGLVPGYPYLAAQQTRAESAFFALTGTRTMTGEFQIMPRFEAGPAKYVQAVAQGGTWIIHLLFAAGVCWAVRQVFRSNQPDEKPAVAVPIAATCLLAILFNAVLFVAIRPVAVDHYFNGSCGVYVVIVGLALKQLASWRWSGAVVGVAIVCLSSYTALSLANLQQTQGRQLGYGPVLEEQVRVVNDFRAAGEAGFETDVIHMVFVPHGVRTLWRLQPADAPSPHTPGQRFVTSAARDRGELVIQPQVPQNESARGLPLLLDTPLKTMH